MAIAGIVLIVICVVLIFIRRSQQSKLFEISATETSTAASLKDAAKYVAERMGEAGSFNKLTEVKGIIKSDQPLTSELGQQGCVYYSMSVTREYEEDYWETDSQSKQQVKKTRRSSDTVSQNTQRVPFWVEDATGRILVNPEGADVQAVQVVDRFEQSANRGGSFVLSLGSFTMDLGGMNGSRTLGYRFREHILPLERQVYILGEARDSSGEVAMVRPREKKPFLISLKSEEELVQSAASKIKWLLVGAVASGGLGLALILTDLVR